MISAEQRKLRRQSAGSSDTPAIIGVDPWRNAADVYYSKLAEIADEPNEAMQIGNWMEPVLLDWAATELGISEYEIGVGALAPDGILSANFDGLTAEAVIEAKYVGPRGADWWGPGGSDQVPEHVALQVQHQMYVAKRDIAHVPAAIVRHHGLSFELFHVPRDQELIEDLVTAVIGWWRAHVLAGVPPANFQASLQILKRIRREPKSICDLGQQGVEAWLAREIAIEAVGLAETKKNEATANVLALLGINEAGRLPDGQLIWYALENAGKRVDLERLRLEHPALAAELAVPTTRRVLRLKKGAKT